MPTFTKPKNDPLGVRCLDAGISHEHDGAADIWAGAAGARLPRGLGLVTLAQDPFGIGPPAFTEVQVRQQRDRPGDVHVARAHQ